MSIVLTVEEVLEFIKAYPGCTPDHLTMGLSMDFYKYFVMLVVDHLVEARIVQRNANGELFNVARPVERQKQSRLIKHNGNHPPVLLNYELEQIRLITTETPEGAGHLVRIFDTVVPVMGIGVGGGLATVFIPYQTKQAVLAIDNTRPADGSHWENLNACNIVLRMRLKPMEYLLFALYRPNAAVRGSVFYFGYD